MFSSLYGFKLSCIFTERNVICEKPIFMLSAKLNAVDAADSLCPITRCACSSVLRGCKSSLGGPCREFAKDVCVTSLTAQDVLQPFLAIRICNSHEKLQCDRI